jgi:hypothetical protein
MGSPWLQRLLFQLSNGSDCPIDGFVDTMRTPEEQVGFQTREWQAVFGEKELVIWVLSGKHKDEGGRNRAYGLGVMDSGLHPLQRGKGIGERA